jgi:capsular polysaccharide biosynthesis protein
MNLIEVPHLAERLGWKQKCFSKLPRFFQDSILRILQTAGVPVELPSPGYFHTVDDWLKFSGQENQYVVKPSFPAETLLRRPPRGIEKVLPERFQIELRKESPALSVTEIPDGRVWGIQGTVLTPEREVLVELARDFRSVKDYPIFQHPWLRKAKHISGVCGLIAAPAGMTYAHWYFDVLTRLAILEEAGYEWRAFDKIIVNSRTLPFQRETLGMLGIPDEKLVAIDEDHHIVCKKLVAPSLPGLTGNFPKWTVPWLRDHLLSHGKIVPDSPKKIYISRRKAAFRRVRNEDELLPILERNGFELVCNEDYSVAEQIGIFSEAEFVLGPMGSSMANLLFSNPGTKVIETYSRHDVNVYTWSFGQFIPLDFAYLLGDPIVEAHVHPHNYDYKIKPEDLIATLELFHTTEDNTQTRNL